MPSSSLSTTNSWCTAKIAGQVCSSCMGSAGRGAMRRKKQKSKTRLGGFFQKHVLTFSAVCCWGHLFPASVPDPPSGAGWYGSMAFRGGIGRAMMVGADRALSGKAASLGETKSSSSSSSSLLLLSLSLRLPLASLAAAADSCCRFQLRILASWMFWRQWLTALACDAGIALGCDLAVTVNGCDCGGLPLSLAVLVDSGASAVRAGGMAAVLRGGGDTKSSSSSSSSWIVMTSGRLAEESRDIEIVWFFC